MVRDNFRAAYSVFHFVCSEGWEDPEYDVVPCVRSLRYVLILRVTLSVCHYSRPPRFGFTLPLDSVRSTFHYPVPIPSDNVRLTGGFLCTALGVGMGSLTLT